MSCFCEHSKKGHSIIDGKHQGNCNYQTHFSDGRPNEKCNCKEYSEAPKVQCAYCGKKGSRERIMLKPVMSVIGEKIYLVRSCIDCFNTTAIQVCKYGGKEEIDIERVGWICQCGKYCDNPDDVKSHGSECDEHKGMMWLKPLLVGEDTK